MRCNGWFVKRVRMTFMLVAFAITAMFGASSAYASGSTVTIDTSSIVNNDFLGFGGEFDPTQFMSEAAANGFNDDWWEVEKQRVAKLHPSLVRVWYQTDWMEPANDNNDPDVTNWSNMQTNSAKMQSVYKVLDFLKSEQIDVMLVAGWKMDAAVQSWLAFSGLPSSANSAPNDLDEWAEWVSASLHQLITVKGYDNIKYVMSYNEPSGGDFETPAGIDPKDYYKDMYQAIHDRLIADGMRSTIKLVGPDESGSSSEWTAYAATYMNDVLDIYDGHAYNMDYSTLPIWLSTRNSYIAPTGKPHILTEFAARGTNEDRSTFQYGVNLADLMVSGMRNGVSSMLYWRLADQQLVDPLNFIDTTFGAWPWLPESTMPRYSYYSLGLFSTFTGSHAQVLLTTSDDPDLHVTSVRRADGEYTVYVVNSSSSASKSVDIQFNSSINKTVSRHLYTSTLVPTPGAVTIPSDASWTSVGSSFSDTNLPANSVAVYTTVGEPEQIEITPGEISAVFGSTTTFNDTVIGSTYGTTWSVLGGVSQGAISTSGTFTAPNAMPPMPQTIIKATRVGDPSVYGLAVIQFKVLGLKAVGDYPNVNLSWRPSQGASSYNVKRSTTPGGPYTVIASSVTATTYVDSDISDDTLYYYVVSAEGAYGENGNSSEVTPSNYFIDNFNGTAIDLTKWRVIDKGFRSTAVTGIGASQSSGSLTFSGTTSVNYWGGKGVQSIPFFQATASSPLTVKVDRVSANGTGSGYRSGIKLWRTYTENIHFSQNSDTGVWAYNLNDGSDVTVYTNSDHGDHEIKLVHDGSNVHFLVDDVEYASVPVTWNNDFSIMLTGEARQNGDSVTAVFDNFLAYSSTQFLSAPAGFTAVAGDSQVNLSWGSVPGATSYTVKRRTVAGGAYTPIASNLTSAAYTDTGLSNGTAYDYVVSAVNSTLTSVHSKSVKATPADGSIIIDNLQAEKTGTWNSSASLPNYYGSDYAFNATGTGVDSICWKPTITQSGNYKVYYRLPNGNGDRASNAPFTVYYNGGSQTFLVNEQTSPGGNWILLGTFDFALGATGYVELTDNANSNYVIADAVKFTKN
ncbi:golvesin C-terminal-like domain-containing protein [Paenibacillus sp. Soil750]|uniref:golvesin C-terminal-like domain-containing protein n=1 Tax=Paenibacillus sp. Soil750 TaxID=1736398 RepID=UPI0006FA38E0|nr:hypothetical protein [Paenibacillus sp. Soil750]KRE63341.1 hypothetical protein ASL11_23600 [Paenibacillus sp. Soil750]